MFTKVLLAEDIDFNNIAAVQVPEALTVSKIVTRNIAMML